MTRTVQIFLIFCFSLQSFPGFSQDLDHIRNQYQKANKEEATCKALIEMLRLKENEITSIELAYLGALQTIWANHVFNPISKLNTFKKGKKNIEQAIKQDSENTEIRFIRLSIQKNAPSLLGYNLNIKEDTEFIKNNRSQISSDVLQKNIDAILTD